MVGKQKAESEDRRNERAPATATTPASPGSPARFCFPRARRILKTADFDRAMKTGVRVVDARLVVWGVRNGLGHTRLGLTVGRKHGGAVQRNRIKRVLREGFRLCQHELPVGLDLVCAPRIGGRIERDAVRESLLRLAARVARSLAES